MTMEVWQKVIMVFAIAMGTIVPRTISFIVFPENRKIPSYISYLGKTLPVAMIGLLVVYCLRDTNFSAPFYALPELAAVGVTVLLHCGFRQSLISIAGGTAVYVAMLQVVFG